MEPPLKARSGWTKEAQATKTNARLTDLEAQDDDLAELIEEFHRGLGTIQAAIKRYLARHEQRRYPRKDVA
jgi:hypothetical protein